MFSEFRVSGISFGWALRAVGIEGCLGISDIGIEIDRFFGVCGLSFEALGLLP